MLRDRPGRNFHGWNIQGHKVIAYISYLNQIFDEKNKNGSVKGANNN